MAMDLIDPFTKSKRMRERCDLCGSVSHPTNLCSLHNHYEQEDLSERLKKAQKNLNDAAEKRKKKRVDGPTFMVSIIHPNHTEGSTFVSERAGKTPREAAMSYFMDLDDNMGAELAHRDAAMTLLVVVDSRQLYGGKIWKVIVFQPQQKDDDTWELIEFS